MKFEPTPVGNSGGELPVDAPLNPGACPECPWRKEMTPGFNIAFAAGPGMMAAATVIHDVTRQSCHMVLDHRCRGAEIFRANVGLPAETRPSDAFMESESEAMAIWRKRGYFGGPFITREQALDMMRERMVESPDT